MILVLNIECSPSFILGQGNLQFVALVVIAKSEFYSIKTSPFYLFFLSFLWWRINQIARHLTPHTKAEMDDVCCQIVKRGCLLLRKQLVFFVANLHLHMFIAHY